MRLTNIILSAGLALALLGCASVPSTIPNLACEIAAAKDRECADVPALEGGRLELGGGAFELIARYEACYGGEDVTLAGSYEALPHPAGVDLELLAAQIPGDAATASSQPRTIATISLDPDGWRGRITDTAMVIRSRGTAGVAPRVLELRCSEQ